MPVRIPSRLWWQARQISPIDILAHVVSVGADVVVAWVGCRLAAPASTGPWMSSRGV